MKHSLLLTLVSQVRDKTSQPTHRPNKEVLRLRAAASGEEDRKERQRLPLRKRRPTSPIGHLSSKLACSCAPLSCQLGCIDVDVCPSVYPATAAHRPAGPQFMMLTEVFLFVIIIFFNLLKSFV